MSVPYNRQLILHGHRYNKNYDARLHTKWACPLRTSGCKAFVMTRNEDHKILKSSTAHIHPPIYKGIAKDYPVVRKVYAKPEPRKYNKIKPIAQVFLK